MICISCGKSFKQRRDAPGRYCAMCIQIRPYDLVIHQGNCTFQAHSDLMTKAQLKRVFKVFGDSGKRCLEDKLERCDRSHEENSSV